MKSFKLKSLSSWNKVSKGDVLKFDAKGGRRVKLQINSNDVVELWGDYNPEIKTPVLLAAGDGMFSLEVTVENDLYVEVRSTEGSAIFMAGTALDHRVAVSEREVFTSVEPRTRRNSDYDRMMMLMKLNEENRDRKLAAAIEGIQKAPPVEEQVIEEPPALAPAPAPKVEVKPDAQSAE